MKTQVKREALTGKALLKKVDEIPHLSRREKARACGYVSSVKDGEDRVNIGAFLNALLEAKGIAVDADIEKTSRGRSRSYRASIQKNGQVIIGPAYTEELGLKVGDVLEIKLGSKHIHLKQITAKDE
ncbi:MAG TPA: AbrB family transcriptional regulator [Stenomitos sp.]